MGYAGHAFDSADFRIVACPTPLSFQQYEAQYAHKFKFIDLTADPNPTCSGIDPNGLASDKLHVAGAVAADFACKDAVRPNRIE